MNKKFYLINILVINLLTFAIDFKLLIYYLTKIQDIFLLKYLI